MIPYRFQNFKYTGLVHIYGIKNTMWNTKAEDYNEDYGTMNPDYTIKDLKSRILSFRQAAKVLGVSKTSIERYLSNNPDIKSIDGRGISISTLISLASYFILAPQSKKDTREKCLCILVDLIDQEKGQDLFNSSIEEYYSQFLSRPKENLLDTTIKSGSFVYLIKNLTTGNLKIGFSSNPSRRFRALQQATDCDLQLLAFIDGSELIEQQLLHHYSQYQVRGEWFKPIPQIYEAFGLEIDNIVNLNKKSA